MSNPCTVCAHPDRAKIDGLLLRGRPTRKIASQFGLSRAAVCRHEKHKGRWIKGFGQPVQPNQPTGPTRPPHVGTDASLLDQIAYSQSQVWRAWERAEERDDMRAVLMALREVRANQEFLARLTGQLVERRAVQTNVTHEVEQMDVPALKAKLDELRAELDTIDDNDGPTIQ